MILGGKTAARRRRPIEDRTGAGSSGVPFVTKPRGGKSVHAIGAREGRPAVAKDLRPAKVGPRNNAIDLIIIVREVAAIFPHEDETGAGIIVERPRLTVPTGVDETLRVGSLGERVIRRNRAVKPHAQHLPTEILQGLRLVLRIIAVAAQVGVLIVLARGDVKHPFGGMRQQCAADMLPRLVSIPFQQTLLARRVQRGLGTLAHDRPARDAGPVLGRRMIGQMVGKKHMRRQGEIRMQRHPMQPAISAEIGIHAPHPMRGASDGIQAPQVARATGDPRASIGSEGQIHGLAHDVRAGDDFDREARRRMSLCASGRGKREGDAGKGSSDGNEVMTMQHGRSDVP